MLPLPLATSCRPKTELLLTAQLASAVQSARPLKAVAVGSSTSPATEKPEAAIWSEEKTRTWNEVCGDHVRASVHDTVGVEVFGLAMLTAVSDGGNWVVSTKGPAKALFRCRALSRIARYM